MKDCRENLIKYLKEDVIYQDWLSGKLDEPSDFEIFCINHCKDIQKLISRADRAEYELFQKEKEELKGESNDKTRM